MKTTLFTAGTCLLMAIDSTYAASLITFTDFNAVASGNTAIVGGSMDNLTVSRAGDGSTASNYVYSFTYANQSFDGDATLDTLSFDIRVQGLSGGTISTGLTGTNTSAQATGSATLGTTAASVSETAKSGGSGDATSKQTWTVGNANMDINETLVFSLENFSVTTSTGTYGATLGLFTNVSMWEGGGNTHQTVVGSGTSLLSKNWSNNSLNQFLINSVDQSPILYVSQGSDAAPSAENNWGLEHLDFTVNVDVIPEPSTSALLLGGLGMLALARRRA